MGGLQKVVQADVLCRFEVRDTCGDDYRQYAFLTAPSSRSGTHPAQQVFVCLEPVDWDLGIYDQGTSEFAGLVLQLQTLLYVKPEGSFHLPLQPEPAGRLRMFTSDQFAAHLLDLPVRVDPARDSTMVSAHVMHFQDILPSRVVITGVSSSGLEMTATFDSAPGDSPDPDDGGEDTGLNHGDQIDDAEETHFDLLSVLEQQHACSEDTPATKKRKGNNISSCSKKSAKRKEVSFLDEPAAVVTGNPVLDDPCLQSFVSSESLHALRSAYDICEGHDTTADVSNWARFEEGVASEDPCADIEDFETFQDVAVLAENASPGGEQETDTIQYSMFCLLFLHLNSKKITWIQQNPFAKVQKQQKQVLACFSKLPLLHRWIMKTIRFMFDAARVGWKKVHAVF